MKYWKCAWLSLLAAHGAWALTPETSTIEYFNTDLQHYFITANPIEALAIDQGSAGAGWVRTGRGFGVWTDTAAAPSDAAPVCRFYSSGSNAHFYTADPAECAQLQALQQTQSKRAVSLKAFTGWAYEGIAFYALVPSAGTCASDTEPVYRFYNPGTTTGTGSSHRFVTSADMASMMASLGWTSEGIAFCSPVGATGTSAPADVSTASFPELSATWTGNAHWRFEVSPGGTEADSTAPITLTITAAGAVTGSGNGCTITGTIDSGDGFHSLYRGSVSTTACTEAHFIGTFPLRLARLGSALIGMQFGSETTTLEVEVDALLSAGTPPAPPPPPSSGPTTYAGNVAWITFTGTGETASSDATATPVRAVILPLSLTIDGSTLTGSGNGCTFNGTLNVASTEEITGTATATGCTDTNFNGTYPTIRLDPEDGSALGIDFEKQTTSGSTTMRVQIRGVLVAGSTVPPPPPPPTPITGTWTGDARWTVVTLTETSADGSSTSTTATLSLMLASGGVLTGSGGGCSFAGTLTQNEDKLTGSVTATGCNNTVFNGTYTSVALALEDGGALGVDMRMSSATMRVSIAGILPAGTGTPPLPPPPPPTPIIGTWTGDAHWIVATLTAASADGSSTSTTATLSLTLASGGVLTGSGGGCSFTGTLTQNEDTLTGSVTATGCSNTVFNGTYTTVTLALDDGGALGVDMRMSNAAMRVSIVGVLPAGTGTPPPPPPSFSLTGTWASADAKWMDLRIVGTSHTESESEHPLMLTIAADGGVTGNGFGCSFTGSLKPIAASTTSFSGPLSAASCTNSDFNGAYNLFVAHAGDEGSLDVAMSRESIGTALIVHAAISAELAKR